MLIHDHLANGVHQGLVRRAGVTVSIDFPSSERNGLTEAGHHGTYQENCDCFRKFDHLHIAALHSPSPRMLMADQVD